MPRESASCMASRAVSDAFSNCWAAAYDAASVSRTAGSFRSLRTAARWARRIASSGWRTAGSAATARTHARPDNGTTASGSSTQRFFKFADRVPELSLRMSAAGPGCCGPRRYPVSTRSPADIRRRLIEPSERVQHRAEVVVRLRVIGVEARRVLKFSGRLLVSALDRKNETDVVVRRRRFLDSGAAIRETRPRPRRCDRAADTASPRHRGAADCWDRTACTLVYAARSSVRVFRLMSALRMAKSAFAVAAPPAARGRPFRRSCSVPRRPLAAGGSGLRGLAAELS